MLAEIFAVVFEFILTALLELILWVFVKPLKFVFRLLAALFLALWSVLTSTVRKSSRK